MGRERDALLWLFQKPRVKAGRTIYMGAFLLRQRGEAGQCRLVWASGTDRLTHGDLADDDGDEILSAGPDRCCGSILLLRQEGFGSAPGHLGTFPVSERGEMAGEMTRGNLPPSRR